MVSALRSQPRAPRHDVESVQNWLANTQNAILDEEAAYVKHHHDLISIAPKSRTPLRQYYARVDKFVGVFITLMGMLMLIAPLWVLAVTEGIYKRLGVITGFIVLFLGLVAFTTVAKPFESLAAAAAYSAVLVVFLQIAA
ncbi:hypothetical protein BDV96DRAFT_602651 [Lophiotrema nucula]|uniref:DUF6594 domain-containing protein n=1 Tax=Lophiotrema nucula TaxID=690887 RepID=A0A6A5YZ93_9PLEO|nr:hypothetical protein BDV96DRAFT_602651 [Lophiotrema nucula]